MAKVKLVHFEIVSLINESKRLVDFLQKTGAVELENIEDDELIKYQTDSIVENYKLKNEKAVKAYRILEQNCEIKRSFVESFNDCKNIEYGEYKLLCDRVDIISAVCDELISLNDELSEIREKIVAEQTLIDYYKPWINLDIPMASKRTLTTNIFVGTFNEEYSEEKILKKLKEYDDSIDDIQVHIVSKEKMLTCAVFMCHCSSAEKLGQALSSAGFIIPDKIAMKLPVKAIEDCTEKISEYTKNLDETKNKISEYLEYYENIRFLSDFYNTQKEKYKAVTNAATTENVFFLRGYIPESVADDIKFRLEKKFTAQMEFSEPDYENADVPVLIENGVFADGVESITNMYSPPSNKDIDPNPIMAFFYYLFFGFMLSDAGYGVLMLIFSVLALKKFKVQGSMKKMSHMIFFCSLSTIFWGTMFGGWFGDFIPTVCTTFLKIEPPDLAVWMDPVANSMDLLIYCMGFGILQLFVGLIIRCYIMCKNKEFFGAFCETVPVMIFVVGFAIVGAGIITDVPDVIKPWGTKLLTIGAVLIILTAGRSSKNILGKLGGGLYGLYNTTTGYLGDILSYSRLLALGLVTGVIANAVNLLATMPGNIILFVPIFLLGHTINLAINVIGTYVHTNRLQYVEFFSKFYEGSGRIFEPFKINSKFFTIKEDKKYD